MITVTCANLDVGVLPDGSGLASSTALRRAEAFRNRLQQLGVGIGPAATFGRVGARRGLRGIHGCRALPPLPKSPAIFLSIVSSSNDCRRVHEPGCRSNASLEKRFPGICHGVGVVHEPQMNSAGLSPGDLARRIAAAIGQLAPAAPAAPNGRRHRPDGSRSCQCRRLSASPRNTPGPLIRCPRSLLFPEMKAEGTSDGSGRTMSAIRC